MFCSAVTQQHAHGPVFCHAEHIRSAHTRLPNAKHTRSRAACSHCSMFSLHTRLPNGKHSRAASAHAQYVRTAHTPAKWQAYPLTRSLRSRAACSHCTRACQMVSTPAHAQPPLTRSMFTHLPNGKLARSRAASALSPKSFKSEKACSRS